MRANVNVCNRENFYFLDPFQISAFRPIQVNLNTNEIWVIKELEKKIQKKLGLEPNF